MTEKDISLPVAKARPSRRLTTRELTLCALFTALSAIGAFIQVPVPYMDYFTLQFFFVLLSGMLLGGRLGAISVGTYVVLGLFGLPVFAAGGGISYVLRPSFGYLLGFIAASFVTGTLSKLLKAKGFGGFLAAALSGFVVTYAIGITYKYLILNFYLGEPAPLYIVFLSCFPLDIPGDLVLCFLAALVGMKLRRFGIQGGCNR